MINIYQIYYNEETKSKCYPEYKHYYNRYCTPFFENSVILDLIDKKKHCEGEYFGVWSCSFRDKVDRRQKFTPEIFEKFVSSTKGDVFSAHRYHSKHVPAVLAQKYHPNFVSILQRILNRIGYKADLYKEARFIIYSNHFIAQKCVYYDFVETLLRPAMEVMSKKGTDIYNSIWQNSMYKGHGRLPEHLKPLFGVDFYPYHTFLCERLIMLYLNNNPDIVCRNL
jgi:hypothetical protein